MFYAAGEAAVATATTQEVNPIPHPYLPPSLLLDHILLQPDSSEPVGGGSGVEWRWLRVLLGILARKKLC